jgi:hypothetical protein
MVGKVRLTCLAAINLVAAEVGVVSQPHDEGPYGKTRTVLVLGIWKQDSYCDAL